MIDGPDRFDIRRLIVPQLTTQRRIIDVASPYQDLNGVRQQLCTLKLRLVVMMTLVRS